MNPEERLKLQDMIQQNNVEDNTSKIQELKHSSLIRADVKAYVQLKQKYPKSESNMNFSAPRVLKDVLLSMHIIPIYTISLLKMNLTYIFSLNS